MSSTLVGNRYIMQSYAHYSCRYFLLLVLASLLTLSFGLLPAYAQEDEAESAEDGEEFAPEVVGDEEAVVDAPSPTTAGDTQTSAQAGVGMSPAIIEPDDRVQPGETIVRTIEISNLESRDRTLYLIPRNITGFSGGNAPMYADIAEDSTGLELADWVSLSSEEIDIAANGSQVVEITINVPEDAPPGSHFGGIYISAEAPRLRESGAGISYGVANIITLIVDGEIETRASIRSFSTDRFVYGVKDVSFAARVENAGNVLIQPIGPLTITNMFGSEVAQLMVNERGGRVIPGSERTFRVDWQEESPGFGRYEAVISFAYDSGDGSRTMSSTVSFWILPMNIVLPAIGVLLVLLLAVYIGVKLYIRRALTMQGGSTRRLVKQRRQAGMPVGLLLLVVMLSVTAIFLILLLLLFA